MSDMVNGVIVGIVRDLEDPEQMGRIKVEFPTLGQDTSNWTRIAAPMSGDSRGFQFMPEVDDEVLVAFENGNVNYPYVIGFLWNGVHKPPKPAPADAKKRTLKTVSGHVLEFSDEEGSEKITLQFKGGNPSITIEQSKISIAFDGSNYIELSASGVKVKGTLIELN
jgi:uncharacterized protein involved in type VI secretion and phage assembly